MAVVTALFEAKKGEFRHLNENLYRRALCPATFKGALSLFKLCKP